jgi:hypothetical protein
MDVEPSSSHTKEPHGWEPGKCIPQSEKTPRYLIGSTKVSEHTQFMMEHALIGKFLGLWPSERDLTQWIKHLWNPKGDYEVQLRSKVFSRSSSTTWKIRMGYLIMGYISTNHLVYSCGIGKTALAQKRRNS